MPLKLMEHVSRLAQSPLRWAVATGVKLAITHFLEALGGMQQAQCQHFGHRSTTHSCGSLYRGTTNTCDSGGYHDSRGAEMMGRFLRVAPQKFSRTAGEDDHEFFTTFPERLYTLGLVQSRGADYTTYQLDGPTMQ